MVADEKGFSLIELIVSMAILVIVGIAIMGFFTYSVGQYTRGNEETTMQVETQTTQNQLQEMLLQTSAGVVTESMTLSDGNIHPGRKLTLYTKDESDRSEYIQITFDDKEKELYYQEFQLDGSEKSEKQVFASNITDWKVTLYDDKEQEIDATAPGEVEMPVKAKVWLQVDVGSRSYSATQTVALRNEIYATAKQAKEKLAKHE